MDIVTALGGKDLFNIYAGLHLVFLFFIAFCQVIKLFKD